MLRVALLHFCFEDYTVQLANALTEFAEVILIHPEQLSALHRSYLNTKIKTVSFWKPRIRDGRNLLVLRQIRQMLQDLQPDVLHVQETNNSWYDLSLLFGQLPPLVTTIHDVFRHPGDQDLKFGSEYTRRIAYYRSQHLIVHAQSIKDALMNQFRVPQHRISVLPHGELGSLYTSFAVRQYQSSSETVAHTINHCIREPYTLLFFGRIWPYKGLRFLLEAMPLIAQQFPQVKLVIAGRGDPIERYFPNGYDPKRYELLNHFIPFAAVAELFQRSTAVVLPYTESSQSGVAAIAYATGTPVIASQVGGLAEMIRHQQDGLLVPAADGPALANAISGLLGDPDLQNQLRTAALARCQTDLNWSTIAAQTVEIYQKVHQKSRQAV